MTTSGITQLIINSPYEEPALKEALRAAAQREHRSIANMVEVLILDYCGRNGIAIPEQDDLFDNGPKQTKGRK
jgi:hypothetical protein